jgi:hypothetical protein
MTRPIQGPASVSGARSGPDLAGALALAGGAGGAGGRRGSALWSAAGSAAVVGRSAPLPGGAAAGLACPAGERAFPNNPGFMPAANPGSLAGCARASRPLVASGGSLAFLASPFGPAGAVAPRASSRGVGGGGSAGGGSTSAAPKIGSRPWRSRARIAAQDRLSADGLFVAAAPFSVRAEFGFLSIKPPAAGPTDPYAAAQVDHVH